MMRTRRKSKQVAATAPSVAEQEHDGDPFPSSISIPDDIDTEVLSNLLPDISLTSPSPDSIISIYRFLIAQASQVDTMEEGLENARAEAQRMEIELDQAIQDRESLAKDMESSLESTQTELTQVKQKRDELLASNSSLQSQITVLSSSQSTSSFEVTHLKTRVEDTEREKRDLVGVISRLKEENTQRDDEIQTLRASLKEARHEHQALEAQVRQLRSVETSTKFKVDSLTQQLQLAQAETERATSELTSKSDEFSKLRRSKHAELLQLQASFDALTQTHSSTESTLKALQSSHTAQSHQLTSALARVQDLTGQLAEQDATHTSEVAGLKRLVGMMEERENQAKEIVQGIEREWASVGERAERRENTLREEADRERRAKEQAEKRVEKLEAVLDQLDRDGLGPAAGAGTPRRASATPDLLMQGMMGLSPTIAMASKSQRAGKSFTEVYADYVQLQDEFARKSAEYDHMDRTLQAVLAQIEERAPILSQQRSEYERLQSESSQLASQLSQALAERDAQGKVAQDTAQKLVKSSNENDLLQQQLNDLGRQVQALLQEINRRDDPTLPPDSELEAIPPDPAENIDAVITNNLVLFRSIGGLQEQNQKLLRIVRELGAKMEAEERDYREAVEMEQGEAVREAHEAMQGLAAQLESQKKSSEVTIQAYMKERDALRSMLARAERAPGMNGSAASAMNGASEEITGIHPTGGPNLAKELAELQGQFDAYTKEMGDDSVRLRDEAAVAQREAGKLGAELAKANARIGYLTDRHRMAQEQISIQGRDLDSISKLYQQLQDQKMRSEIQCHNLSEDLSSVRSHLEQLRNESANLRAEKKIWESVQSRLVEENKTLALERSHLSDLMGNVQKMHKDLELSGENDRRRLENQVQMMESQTHDLRAQLNQERDSARHLNLQRDIELRDLQTRLDKSSQDFFRTRESLVVAETSKKHLEERIEDLTRQLHGNEEKLAVYERRSTVVNGVAQQVDNDLSREQQLEAEVAELRSTLRVAEVDLATARSHVQQFQEISQANESALATLNTTHDEYKASTETQIARHESEYQALQERLSVAQAELAQLSEKHRDLQRTLETERLVWTNDKKTLEDTIVDITTSEKNFESDRSLRENETRQQEERAKAAEDRYSREVVAHADSIKMIETLRQQLSSAQSRARDNLSAADTALAKLATSEGSWKQQKEALEKELADLNTRCRDLAAQNTILHQHMESVSSQATRIRQAADASATAASGEGEPSGDEDGKLFEMQAVIAYLRKEKDIVDLQLELSKQETARLRTQTEYLAQSLDETRVALSEERERAAESATSDAQHAELVEKINQLNILRESNATLRSECETSNKRIRELDMKLMTLSAELEPVKEQARVSKAETEALELQLKRAEEESRRWKERNTQLLSKYDRIDPAEMQTLKDEIAQLKTQKDGLEKSLEEREELVATQTKRIEALEDTVRQHRESSQKSFAGFKQRLGTLNNDKSALNTKIAEQIAQVKTLTVENETLQSAKSALEAQLAELKVQKADNSMSSEVTADESTKIIAELREERDKLLVEKESWVANSASAVPPGATTTNGGAAWEAEKAELVKALDAAVAQGKVTSEQARKATEDAKNFRFSSEKLQARLADMQKARASDSERAAAQQQTAVTAAVDKLRTELQTSDGSAASEEILQRHRNELRALEERLSAKYKADLKAAVDAAVSASKKEQSTTSTITEEEKQAAIVAAIAEHEKQFESRRAEELASAVDRGRMEQAAKGKLKDSQLVKAQNRVKELEAQIQAWKNAGALRDEAAAIPATPTGPAAMSPATPGDPSTSSAAKSTAAAANSTLPRKPSLNAPATPIQATVRGVARGTARGAPRGGAGRGINIRGRGGAPASVPVVEVPKATAGNGVSIMGASKRPREEAEAADDSLAKRLKPVEATKPPVQLRRPPPT